MVVIVSCVIIGKEYMFKCGASTHVDGEGVRVDFEVLFGGSLIMSSWLSSWLFGFWFPGCYTEKATNAWHRQGSQHNK